MPGENEVTEEIEYTRVMKEEFGRARPKRPLVRGTFPKRRGAAAAAGTQQVFEDVIEGEELVVHEPSVGGQGVLLGKPARKGMGRMGGEQGKATAPETELETGMNGLSITDNGASKRDGLKKEPRRRTIFVPSDDTTIMTIHPGANNTGRLDDTFQLPAFQPQPLLDCLMEDQESHMKEQPARRSRMSLAVAPRRVPLQQMEARNSNLPGVDVVGQNGGKENLPPGYDDGNGEFKKAKSFATKPVLGEKAPLGRSRLHEPTAASQARQTLAARNAVPVTKQRQSLKTTSSLNTSKPRPVSASTAPRVSLVQRAASCSPKEPAPKQSTPTTRQASWKTNAHFLSASDVSKARIERYPVINANVAQPELYEDGWLSQQEVALTELINEIFTKAQPDAFAQAAGAESLRERLVSVYHQPEVAALHKRLQASLSYGALCKPRDMPSAPELTQDLGLRKRYIHLWLDSYELETLSAAAKVVVGRGIAPASTSPGVEADGRKASRRALIGFLETFFITVDDVSSDGSHGADLDVQMQRRNKTVLRSLMLIWILDRAPTAGSQSKCLFKSKSPHKSSTSVLNALASMLLPTVGDIGRTLRHQDYTVSHVQDPLDEVKYRIQSLAVDLRDGILLTKLVELLLYRNDASSENDDRAIADETVTIQLPDTTVVESARFDSAGVTEANILSRHLKIPCLGRAQKLYNVEVALSALSTHDAFKGSLAASVTAEAVVDGHRELTINFLWTLLSGIGLDVLLDRKLLATDIARFGRTSGNLDGESIEGLLQAWAAGYCSTAGIQITNLTTLFADGKAYAAIVNAFASFFHGGQDLKASTSSQLRTMGCSEAFIRQLVPAKSSIPSRQTTLSNLAFLASRLLPLAARHHAAMTIQRAYRRKRSALVVHQRVALMRIANDCAKVVQTQQRLTNAAMVLQRAWRGVLGGRIARLELAVTGFQSLARGWKGRKAVRKGRQMAYGGRW